MKHLLNFNEINESAYPEFKEKYARMKAALSEALVELRDTYTFEVEGDGVQEYPGGCLVYRIKISDFGKMAGTFEQKSLYKLKEDYEKMAMMISACQRVLKKMEAEGFTESNVGIHTDAVTFQIR